jgi:hypothetical protein
MKKMESKCAKIRNLKSATRDKLSGKSEIKKGCGSSTYIKIDH